MINANELRIGNLVRSIKHEMNVSINMIDGYNTYDDYEPIPLTEDWLIKLGFSADEISWYCWLDYDKAKDTFKVFDLPDKSGYGVINVNGFGICIKYVHQLQNIVWILTGVELTIK